MSRRTPDVALQKPKVARRTTQDRQTHAPPARDSAPDVHSPGWRPSVLVVDDNFDARAINRIYLRAMGCRVYTAADGVEGIDRATERQPDVIVLDLEMPNLNGWDTARLLKRSPATEHIPIVALTAVPGSRETAREAGCDAFLSKPCLPELVWWEIRLLLGLEPDNPLSGAPA